MSTRGSNLGIGRNKQARYVESCPNRNLVKVRTKAKALKLVIAACQMDGLSLHLAYTPLAGQAKDFNPMAPTGSIPARRTT